MSGTFYFDSRSPQVRSVQLLIEALGIDIDQKLIDLFKGEHQSPDFLKVQRNILDTLDSQIVARNTIKFLTDQSIAHGANLS